MTRPENFENQALREQLAAAYPANPTPTAPPVGGPGPQHGAQGGLPQEEALAALSADPYGFVQNIVQVTAVQHLQNMKEQAELMGALSAFRKQNPEARQFEPFILQEVAELIQNDDDGHIEPWNTLLEKGLAAFRKKFKGALKQNPELLAQQAAQTGMQLEGPTNRNLPQATPAFTRDQIAKMSLAEFVANESQINEAMKHNRIR